MTTLCSIINKYIESEESDSLIKLLYFLLVEKLNKTQNNDNNFIQLKFQGYNYVLNNIFLSSTDKENFTILFSKIQKTYYGFARLAHIYRFKYAKMRINTDLGMDDINQTGNHVFTVVQNKCKYLFIISDLINIFNHNLSNSHNFFSEPLVIKNPYNNIPFNKSILYNIYFFILFKIYIIPPLIHGYFLSGLDLVKFQKDNEYIIRNTAINNFVFGSDYSTLYPSINKMFYKYPITNYLCIHKDFPKDKLVNIMRPYLHLYYLSLYSSVDSVKYDSEDLLEDKLRLFIKFNQKFGRIYIQLKKINFQGKKRKIITFNDKHINFYKKYDESKLPKIYRNSDNYFQNNSIVDNDNDIVRIMFYFN